MTKLFIRDIVLAIGEKDGTLKEYRDLKIEFNLTKTRKVKPPNTGQISIHNLSSDTLTEFELTEADNRYCVLKVGYGGEIDTLFEGDVVRMSTEKRGADVVTTLFVGDGHQAINELFSFKSFKAGLPSRKIVEDLISVIKTEGKAVAAGWTSKVLGAVTGKENTATVANGNVMDTLQKLLKKHNLGVSVQNNTVEIVDIGETTGETIALISPETGLIGSPKEVGKGVIKLRSLLSSTKFIPGRWIEVKSEYIEGQFQIEKSVLIGDSRGNKFFADLEVK
jgi:hypothetical protein